MGQGVRMNDEENQLSGCLAIIFMVPLGLAMWIAGYLLWTMI